MVVSHSRTHGRRGRVNPQQVRKIRQMLIELSKVYPVYVNGKPLHQLHNQPVQQTIAAYAKV